MLRDFKRVVAPIVFSLEEEEECWVEKLLLVQVGDVDLVVEAMVKLITGFIKECTDSSDECYS